MQVEALSAPNWAIVDPACSGTPPMRLDRRLLSRQAFACNPWSAVSTQHRGGDDGGSASVDRPAGPPLPLLPATSSAPHQVLEISEPYFDTCAALNPVSRGGATARQGGDSRNGHFPVPSSRGVSLGPKAGAAANFANPAVRVSFPGSRVRVEQCGRSIQRPRYFHPPAWAARACSSPSSHRSARVVS